MDREQEQKWRVYTVLDKDITDSDALSFVNFLKFAFITLIINNIIIIIIIYKKTDKMTMKDIVWPNSIAAYRISKAVVSAYTRITKSLQIVFVPVMLRPTSTTTKAR
jgi:hypothetical protein